MKNAIILALIALLVPTFTSALSVPSSHVPRSPSPDPEPAPKGGGGGGHGGGGGGRGGGGSRGGGGKGSRNSWGAGTGRGGSGNTGKPSIKPVGSVKNRLANYFSPGGGKPFKLSGSSHFAGREMGGGQRSQILGTRRYGSGYPYYYYTSPVPVHHDQDFGVSGQPFPFGFWPLYWRDRGYSDEYGYNTTVSAQRPGGSIAFVEVVPYVGSTWNTTVVNGFNETYWMIGDNSSISTMMSVLVDAVDKSKTPYGCNVTRKDAVNIDWSNSSFPPFQFENVIQWYRSSSFALVYKGYNNSYSLAPLNATTNLSWNNATALPNELVYSPFLHCINNTITAGLPIIDAPPKVDVTSIVLGVVFGVVFLIFIWIYLYAWRKKSKAKKLAASTKPKKDKKKKSKKGKADKKKETDDASSSSSDSERTLDAAASTSTPPVEDKPGFFARIFRKPATRQMTQSEAQKKSQQDEEEAPILVSDGVTVASYTPPAHKKQDSQQDSTPYSTPYDTLHSGISTQPYSAPYWAVPPDMEGGGATAPSPYSHSEKDPSPPKYDPRPEFSPGMSAQPTSRPGSPIAFPEPNATSSGPPSDDKKGPVA